MSKHINSISGKNEKGFTLVEIIVALIILLLIVTAAFPLFTLATKTTHENKARTIANELAKKELEWTMAQVTSANYLNEGTDPSTAPLSITDVGVYYFDNDGNRISERDPDSQFSQFEAYKFVNWVDDPADGIFPEDKIPFDYKELIIEVHCPSLFTGSVTKRADFKTFLAREGTTSPITGVIVEVVRGWTDEAGNRIPVEGVNVLLEGTGPDYSAVTNASGQALIPVSFPNDNATYSYQVSTERSGMINRPDKPAEEVVARPYTTSFVQVEMEEPATLILQFAPSKSDVYITLDGGDMGTKNKTMATGQNSVTFTDLWPTGIDPNYPGKVCSGGTYNLSVSTLLSFDQLPESSEKYPANIVTNNEDESNQLNLWNFINDYNGYPAWVACDDYLQANETINDAEIHSMAFTNPIDITSYKPLMPGVTSVMELSFDNITLSGFDGINDGFVLVYLGEEDAILEHDTDWTPLIKFGSQGSKRTLLETNNSVLAVEDTPGKLVLPSDTNFILDAKYQNSPFRMRFDTHNPNIDIFSFSGIKIRSSYDNFGSIQFTGPGEKLNLKISG